MKKLSTHIKGLDALFHGGIQVTSVTKSRDTKQVSDNKCINNQSDNIKTRDSLVIVIRGARGVNKHLFAMQLMHGLAMSVYDECYANITNSTKRSIKADYQRVIDKLNSKDNEALRYYSINKPTHLLEDMYLDLLIERWISHTNIEYKDLLLDKFCNAGKEHHERINVINDELKELNERTKKILTNFFTIKKEGGALVYFLRRILVQIRKYLCERGKEFEYSEYIAQLLAENVIGYNARTNSIHVRTKNQNDDWDNFLFKRKNDCLKKFFSSDLYDGLDYKSNQYYNFKSEFLNVKFNAHLCIDNNGNINTAASKNSSETNSDLEENDAYESVRNAHSARVNFFSILNNIENELEKNDKPNKDKKGNNVTVNNNISKYPYETVVIDGFSHISEKDLQSLPYNHLLNCLRKLSRISILVFEDTQKTMPDGDIEIEIRSNYDESEDYTFNELRIAKCVNQITSLGWHLYKRQESHIRIYPSLHLNLFKRSYINNQMHELGQPIITDSYATIISATHGANKYYDNPVKSFLKDSNTQSFELFGHLLAKAKELVNEGNLSEEDMKDMLRKILSGEWQNEGDWFNIDNYIPLINNVGKDNKVSIRQHNHCPITTIVGNLNSHKRNIALYSAFSKAHEVNTHVLIVLLDKDPIEMRKKILCPGIFSYASGLGLSENEKTKKGHQKKAAQCKKCYDRISFLNVNSGCIPPEEFLSMLKDHISVYTGEYKDRIKGNNDKKRNLHIIFDDYHRIDFSYPFLSSSNLFTTALISLCEKMNVGLTILCDKDSKRVREVCTLSDYVLCVQREVDDTSRNVTLYTERNGDDIHSGTIIKYTIKDALNLMECNNNPDFTLKGLEKAKSIGSMKEYWRQKYNTFQQNVRSENVDKSGLQKNVASSSAASGDSGDDAE